jgi:hypothetical protein
VFNAGLGNDDIIINASNITALEQTGAGNRARVDGGGGVDTLTLRILVLVEASNGLDDLIVGAPFADLSGKSNAGKSYVPNTT